MCSCSSTKRMADPADLALGNNLVRKWRSYTEEEKLETVSYYYMNRRNLYQMCKKFIQATYKWLPDSFIDEMATNNTFQSALFTLYNVCKWQQKQHKQSPLSLHLFIKWEFPVKHTFTVKHTFPCCQLLQVHALNNQYLRYSVFTCSSARLHVLSDYIITKKFAMLWHFSKNFLPESKFWPNTILMHY